MVAEYQYYQAVKTLEPDIWQQLGAPKNFKIPLVFVSPTGTKLLQKTTNPIIQKLACKHRQAGIQFIYYLIIVLTISIIYFKLAVNA